jgi:hypothetical protein
VLTGWLAQLRSMRDLLVEMEIAEVGAPRTIAEESHVDAASGRRPRTGPSPSRGACAPGRST